MIVCIIKIMYIYVEMSIISLNLQYTIKKRNACKNHIPFCRNLVERCTRFVETAMLLVMIPNMEIPTVMAESAIYRLQL